MWAKLFRTKRQASAEVAAATLMLRCERQLPRSSFRSLSEASLEAIGNLLYVTQVAFVLHWLNAAAGRPQYAERAQRILTAAQIIFDPDMFREGGSRETADTAKYLASLATTAFELVDFVGEHSPEDSGYFPYLIAWANSWLSPLDEAAGTSESITDQVALPLTAILLSQLAEIRKALAEAVRNA